MKKERVLVTGGAGFIGSHLVDLLVKNGHEVVVIDDLTGGRLSNLSTQMENPLVTFHQVDIRKFHLLRPHFEGIDWVFHLAAKADIVPSIENPREYYETNVDGTFNVLECAKQANIHRFIYAASSSCYGIAEVFPTPETAKISPEYPYALTKYLGEQLILHYEKIYQIPSLSLRLFNVYGPRARTTGAYGAVFGVFLAQKLHQKPFTIVGNGTQTRDFTYVTDVAKAFFLAASSDLSGQIFNVGSGGHYSVNTLVDLLVGKKVYLPKRPGEPDCTFADITKIQRALGYEPEVCFEEGVEILLKNIEAFKDAPIWDKEKIEKATENWFKFLGKKTSVTQKI